MARSQPKSLADIFYDFVRDHPAIAAKLAFELGLLGGNAAKAIPWKRLKKASSGVATMPRQLSQAALKLLPTSPELQPQSSRRGKARKHSPRRKTEKLNGEKSKPHRNGHGKV
jgi:hypothetical protein